MHRSTQEVTESANKKSQRVWTKEYHRPLINHRLKEQFDDGLCNCDGCRSESGDGCDSKYHGEYIYLIKKTHTHWIWCYEDDVNHGDI